MNQMANPDAVSTLERDLREIFGSRLQSLVVYGRRTHDAHEHDHGSTAAGAAHGEPAPTHTMTVVDGLSTADLRACAAHVEAWHDRGLATPLVLSAHEFGRSLDAFPFEFGAILADYTLVAGINPFDGLRVEPADLRRACEVEARGHWLHLREGYLETRGRGDALAVLIVQSAPAFAALATSVARLDAVPADNAIAAARHLERRLALPSTTASEVVSLAAVKEISSSEAERIFPAYLDAVERLVRYIDAWTA
jgi:hypothetical protein